MEKVICGNVTLYRARCPECGEYDLAAKGKHYCCGEYFTKKVERVRIVTTVPRKPFKYKFRQKLIERQNNHCYWCGRSFDTWYLKRSRPQKLKVHIEHRVPYVFTQTNEIDNLVAACNICNGFKSDKIFDTEEQVREYVHGRWWEMMKSGKIKLSDFGAMA